VGPDKGKGWCAQGPTALRPGDSQPLWRALRRSQGGRSTCYLYVHPSLRYLVAVSYWDAVITVLPLNEDGSLGGAALHRVQHPAASTFFAQAQPTREIHWKYRQQWPHAHCVVPEPRGELLFSTDLGLDVCHVWRLDPGCGALEAVQTVQLHPGRGPRHVAFHPRVPACFVVNELDSTVTVLSFHRPAEGDEHQAAPAGSAADAPVSMHSKEAVLQHVQTLSSLPESAQGKSVISPQGIWKAASHSSELRLRPDGRFLCVGNRGHDSIAVFSVDETAGGALTLAHVVPAGGACPRNFNFSRCGAFLLVGCQNSNALTAFAMDTATGALTPKASLELPSPNYVHAL
jgi:6-phosphogluconolactonase